MTKEFKPNEMIKGLVFLQNHRCFKEGDAFVFEPGVNLLVGDQGSGKSTLISCLSDMGKDKYARQRMAEIVYVVHAPNTRIASMDFEKDNPRTMSYFGDNIGGQLNAMFSSHGQFVRGFMESLTKQKEPMLYVFDEPDMALSVRSCHRMVAIFKKMAEMGNQIIASAHNPIIISAFKVFSLEHRKLMEGTEFIKLHETESAPMPTPEPHKVQTAEVKHAKSDREKHRDSRNEAARKRAKDEPPETAIDDLILKESSGKKVS